MHPNRGPFIRISLMYHCRRHYEYSHKYQVGFALSKTSNRSAVFSTDDGIRPNQEYVIHSADDDNRYTLFVSTFRVA